MHLELEYVKTGEKCDFHTAKNVQIQATLFSFLFVVVAIFRRFLTT